MKRFRKIVSLLIVVSALAYMSMFAQEKKDKVSLWHKGHIIVVAPEAVPAHLAHGDTYVTSGFTMSPQVLPGSASPCGTLSIQPTVVQAGGSVTVSVTITQGSSCTCVVWLDNPQTQPWMVASGTSNSQTLLDVQADHTFYVLWQ
jgi:hypothetical protein